MFGPPDLSIIIGTYKTKDITKITVDSIIKHIGKINYEIIIIDDASNDGTYELLCKSFPKIKLIRNRKNLGYCKTYNKGTRLTRGRYILHINSDVQFTSSTRMSKLIEYLDQNPNIGILGNKVLKHDGKLDPPSRHQIPTLRNTISQSIGFYKIFPKLNQFNYYMTYLKDDVLTEVGGVGAFMMTRKEVFENIGLLDEKFILYCQDSDFCFRVNNAGWKLVYYPKSMVWHLHGGTTKQFRLKALVNFHKDMWYYYRKHFLPNYPFILGPVIFLGLSFRFVVFAALETIKFSKQKIIK